MVLLSPPVVQQFRAAKVFNDNTKSINSLDFYEDGSLLITSSDDDSIRVYKTDTGTEYKVIFSRKHGVDLIRYTHSPSCVVCASRPTNEDRTLRYLSLYDNRYLCYFKGHEKRVVSIAMSPLADIFVSGSLDQTVRLWDLRSPTAKGIMNIPEGRSAVSFDPTGVVMAAATAQNSLRLFDIRSMERGPFETFYVEPSVPVEWASLKFSSDGRFMALSTTSSRVLMLDAFNGKTLFSWNTVSNRTNLPLELSFSPDSLFLTCGGDDGKIRTWSTVDGSEVAVWGDHPQPARVVAWNPKMAEVASACQNLALWIPDQDYS